MLNEQKRSEEKRRGAECRILIRKPEGKQKHGRPRLIWKRSAMRDEAVKQDESKGKSPVLWDEAVKQDEAKGKCAVQWDVVLMQDEAKGKESCSVGQSSHTGVEKGKCPVLWDEAIIEEKLSVKSL